MWFRSDGKRIHTKPSSYAEDFELNAEGFKFEFYAEGSELWHVRE